MWWGAPMWQCKWSIYGSAGFAGIRGLIWDGHGLNSIKQPDQVGCLRVCSAIVGLVHASDCLKHIGPTDGLPNQTYKSV